MIAINFLVMIMSWIVAPLLLFNFNDIDDGKIFRRAFFISALALVVSTSLFFVGGQKLANAVWVTDDEPYAVEPIVALNDNNMTHGRIYLRRGYIEEDLYYQYIVELRSGGFKANKVKSSNAVLFIDDDNCRVEWYKQTKKWLYFKDERICHKIYIPEGSLTSDYLVDLN